MEALGLRFQGRGITEGQVESEIQNKTKRAREAAITRLADGTVELSTIQTFCLLSMLEYTGESSQRQTISFFFILKISDQPEISFVLALTPAWLVTSSAIFE